MNSIRRSFTSLFVSLAAVASVACASAPENVESVDEEISACGHVRCAPGTTCHVHKRKASCVPDACPPNTRLCIRGTHYDNTPGVCGCVPDAGG